jgi:hypothetical protein
MTIQRFLPAAVQRELERQETQETLLVFLTIFHRSLFEPIRVVSDAVNYVLDGNTYIGFEFEINLLSDSEGMPRARLTVQNVDKKIGRAIIASVDPVRLNIEVIAASNFDLTAEPRTELDAGNTPRIYTAKYLRLADVEGDELQLTGTIRSWDYMQEQFPAVRATEDRFPALYWS